MMITDQEFLRYQRQIMLPELGEKGQLSLKKTDLLVVGAGGLANATVPYLAAAGIGSITIADGDTVELSNLQRQVMFKETDQGKNKATVMRSALNRLNTENNYTALPYYLKDEQLNEAVSAADIILDCSDNLETRYQINQSCVKHAKILVSAAAIRWQGQLIAFDFSNHLSKDRAQKGLKEDTPGGCYQCFRPTASITSNNKKESVESEAQSCSDSGIAGPVVGIMGLLQATETLKLICGAGKVEYHVLQQFDALSMQWQRFKIPQNKRCPICN